MGMVKNIIKGCVEYFSITANILNKIKIIRADFDFYCLDNKCSKYDFFVNNYKKIKIFKYKDSEYSQIDDILRKVQITNCQSDFFLYSISPFEKKQYHLVCFDNTAINLKKVIDSSLTELRQRLVTKQDEFCKDNLLVIDGIETYIGRLKNTILDAKYKKALSAIQSFAYRPAETFFEALQRILFYNQMIWQIGCKDIGLGHLDWLLEDCYCRDIATGHLTKNQAEEMIDDFCQCLHANYWFKSSALLGDTGQLILLGGLKDADTYHCNELTYMFIESMMRLKLPDPKVLLRVSKKMPDDLLTLALQCIQSGLGEPVLSNDDIVIPAMIQFGYEEQDAYQYATAACWEPLVPGDSIDQNNMESINFVLPMTQMLSDGHIDDISSMEDLLSIYDQYLKKHVASICNRLDETVRFEKSPLLTLLSDTCMDRRKDIASGGAKYCNTGLTSVGLSNVVNSFLNIRRLVFEDKAYSWKEMLQAQQQNFQGRDKLFHQLQNEKMVFGQDEAEVLGLTRHLMSIASVALEGRQNYLGGRYKIGYSAPSYVWAAEHTLATFDGRHDGAPFGVHISGKNGVAPTELLSFAAQLDYHGNRINGNVVDFILSPGFIQKHFDKILLLLKVGIQQGMYQLQMNVVDSDTLIAAKKDPSQFPNLVVRVWGFSAYFKDLPVSYQDNLIRRTLESEGKDASGWAC